MEKNELSYHHGDLRNALVSTATEIIEQGGLAAVSLRKIGAALGVSQAAMYGHFKNKKAMLEAVAVAGYEQLIELQLNANQQSGSSFMERVQLQGEAYVRFAKNHPHLYQLMFGQLFLDGLDYPGLKACKRRSFNILQEVFREAFANQETTRDPYIAAVGGRVLVHGLSSMIIDGTLSPGKKLDSEQEDILVSQVLASFGRRP